MSDGIDDSSPASPARGSHYQPSPAIAVGLLVLFMVCVGLVLHSVNSLPVGGATNTTAVRTTTSTPSSTTIPRSQVLVQVANGTSQVGLARTFTTQLQPHGWDVLPPINGKVVSSSVVYYKPGFQWAATAVATSLNIPVSAVTPLGTATPCTNAQHDDVVLLLGHNA